MLLSSNPLMHESAVIFPAFFAGLYAAYSTIKKENNADIINAPDVMVNDSSIVIGRMIILC